MGERIKPLSDPKLILIAEVEGNPAGFIMAIPNCSVGEDGVLIFADVAVNPDPDSSQLADIAISTAISAKTLLGWEPRVALLSFSTQKSASHPLVDKVIEANHIAQEKSPHLLVEGDLQADAALVPEVAQKKVKKTAPSTISSKVATTTQPSSLFVVVPNHYKTRPTLMPSPS